MHASPAQRPNQAAAAVARVRAASVCGKPTMGAWSITPFLGVDADHEPGPRRFRVTSP